MHFLLPDATCLLMRKQEGYTFICNHGTFGDELFVHESIENYGTIKENFGGQEQCRP